MCVLFQAFQARPKEKAAYQLAQAPYNQALGLWYAEENSHQKPKQMWNIRSRR